MARPKKNEVAKAPVQAQPVAPAPSMAPAGMPMPQQMMPHPPPALAPQAIAQQPMQMPPVMPQAPRTIGIEEFFRVRESVHSRFNTIIDIMQNFANDFVRQTNLLIGEPAAFDNGVAPPLPALFAAPVVAEEQKKERKKRTHDPNAPKRPLTPYFLYMQTARPIIASDLGSEAPKGAVQEEGQRRWAQMTPQEKTAWNNAYQFNLRMYNARVHSYKAGNGGARDMSDEEALRYADENGLPPAELASDEPVVANDQDAIAEQLQMAAPAMPVAPVQEEAKTPKAKVTRKRKSAAADVEDGDGGAAKTATPASPVSKRKRQSKAAETVEEPKKSSRKKKNA